MYHTVHTFGKKGFRIFFENLGSTDDGRESSEQIIYFKMKILDLDTTTCIELILFLLYNLLISQYYAFQESQSLYVCVCVCICLRSPNIVQCTLSRGGYKSKERGNILIF